MTAVDNDEREERELEAPLNEYEIPRLELELRGQTGYVTFRAADEMTSKEQRKLRALLNQDESKMGATTHDFLSEALVWFIVDWEIPGMTLPLPKGRDAVKFLEPLPAVLRTKMEKHIKPYLKKAVGSDESEDGDRTP